MSYKDSDKRRGEYLDELEVEIVKDPVTRWDPDKLLKYADRIAMLQKWAEGSGEQPGPVTLGAHIENRCNEKCSDCSGWRSTLGPRSSLPFNVATMVLDEFSELGGKGVQFSGGGEPWIHPNATDLLEYCIQKGLKVGVISNGTAFDGRACESIGQHCDWVRISMDAAGPEVRKASHGVDLWDTLIGNCKLIMKNRRDGLVIGGAFLCSDVTMPDAEKFIDVCEDLGFTYAQFRPYQYLGAEWYPEHISRRLEEIGEKNKDRAINVITSAWRKEEDKFFRTYDYCWGSHFRTEINANRTLMPCCHLCGNDKNKFGNINKEGDFTRIWQSKSMKRINVRKCLPYCIYHRLNTTLQKFMKPTMNNEFLG